jgi:hypothetical protein
VRGIKELSVTTLARCLLHNGGEYEVDAFWDVASWAIRPDDRSNKHRRNMWSVCATALGATSQKTLFFIVDAVRTWNLTSIDFYQATRLIIPEDIFILTLISYRTAFCYGFLWDVGIWLHYVYHFFLVTLVFLFFVVAWGLNSDAHQVHCRNDFRQMATKEVQCSVFYKSVCPKIQLPSFCWSFFSLLRV